jgi:hypothetical protein
MKSFPTFAQRAALAVLLLAVAPICLAQQGDPTPRKGIDPWDKATVTQIEAKRWIIGAQSQQAGDTAIRGNKPGSKSCVTNVGTTPQPQGQTPRYGPTPGGRQGRITVVNGNVINVCK